MFRTGFIAIILLLLGLGLSAQDIFRKEFDASDPAIRYFIENAADSGVIVFHPLASGENETVRWQILHYNTAFEEINKEQFVVKQGMYYANHTMTDGRLVMQFMKHEKSEKFLLVTYDVNVRNLSLLEAGTQQLMTGTHFTVNGDFAYIGGFTRPTRKEYRQSNLVKFCFPFAWFGMQKYKPTPYIISVNLKSGEVSSIKNDIEGDIEIIGFQKDNLTDGLYLVFRQKRKSEPSVVLIRNYQSNGELSKEVKINADPNKELIQGTLFVTTPTELIFSGTYSRVSKKRKDLSLLAHGLFFCKISGNQLQFIKYHDFNNFSNLSSAIKQSYQTNAKRSREESNIAYQVLLHKDMVTNDSSYVLMGEAFYPEYEYQTRMVYVPSYYSSHYYNPGYYEPQGSWVFIGYRYTHAILAAFDRQGELSWENTFSSSSILSQSVKQKVNVLAQGEELVLVYAFDGMLKYKIVKGPEVTQEEEEYELESLYYEDKIKQNEYTEMEQWYGSTFLVWGKQSIKNRKGKNRTVFYFSKVAFE